MDKKQFSTFAMAMKTYYPKESLLPNEQALELWFNMLQDIPYNVATAALNKWVATQKWSPTIAEIRSMSAEIIRGRQPSWADAWEQAMKAVTRYGWYAMDQAYESMDELTRETVRRIGYDQLCHTENIEADRANFRMIYEQLESRKRTDEMIPAALQEFITKLQGKLKEIERKEEG